jgi:hypothetical protein
MINISPFGNNNLKEQIIFYSTQIQEQRVFQLKES